MTTGTTTTAAVCAGGTCKVCKASVTDSNTAESQVSLTIKFGQLQKNGAIYETDVTHYSVQLTTECGAVLQTQLLQKVNGPPNCCDEERYSATMTSDSTAIAAVAKYVVIKAVSGSFTDDGGVKITWNAQARAGNSGAQ